MKKILQTIKDWLAVVIFGLVMLNYLACTNNNSYNSQNEIIDGQSHSEISETSEDAAKERAIESFNNPRFAWEFTYTILSFRDESIHSFYHLNNRVPESFDELKNSGILMIIPNDYISGKPYQLVDTIDLENSAGFTFSSDGKERCTYEFVAYNRHTGENEVIAKTFKENSFLIYKTIEGVQRPLPDDLEAHFNRVKLEHCMNFFPKYVAINSLKHGETPDSLKEMFQNMGQPIETGWKWSPDEASNYYYEFGIDRAKNQYYEIKGSGLPGRPRSVFVAPAEFLINPKNENPIDGEDYWTFTSIDDIPDGFINLKAFITSDDFYSGYLKIVG